MELLERMNEAIEYIENHLDDEIDYHKVAKLAYCSNYHFQRMFSYIIGIPIAEYIRRRRMTLAGLELQNSHVKVIDLAFKYGYNSPDAFTRAFQKIHGVTPSKARQKNELLKAFPRISFQISIKGDVEMNYRIESKEAFSVFGMVTEVSTVDGKLYNQIPDFWLKSIQDGSIDRLRKVADLKDEELVNGAIFDQRSDGTQKYMICAEKKSENISKEFFVLDVSPSTWAIFRTEIHTADETTKNIQALWKRVFTDWFPTSMYEEVEGPEFEMYHRVSDDKFYAEIWIPVKKK